MPLCPQITNTPITVTQTADFTVSSVLPVVAATTTQLDDAVILIDGKTKAYYQTTMPSSGMTEGDIWFDTDDGYKLYYYTGSAWTSVQDTAIAAAQSAATAAQTTANGKNKIYRQGTTPTGTFAIGDTWFNTSSDNAISRWDGSSWVATSLGNGALASISASKITAGTIDASVITVSNLDAGNISTGTLAAARIATGSLDATKITAGTITSSQISSAYVYAGSITAGQITAGTLTGFTVQTSSGGNSVVLSGSDNALGIKSGGSYAGWIGSIGSGAVLMHYGSSPSSSSYPRVQVSSTTSSLAADGSNSLSITTSGNNMQGNMTFGGTTNTFTNSVVANGTITYPGIATGSGSTMVVVTTGSRVAYTTSSERFKQDIQYIATPGWLDKVMAMKPITYKTNEDYLTEGEPNETQIGFLAEDIYDLGDGLETAVVLDPLGDPFSLSYDRLTVFLTLAIKELKAEIDQLKGE
jgi:hypothetical protein